MTRFLLFLLKKIDFVNKIWVRFDENIMCIFPLQVITLLFLTSKAANIANKTKQDNNREKNQPVNNKRRGGTSKSKRIQAEKYLKKNTTTHMYEHDEYLSNYRGSHYIKNLQSFTSLSVSCIRVGLWTSAGIMLHYTWATKAAQ